MLNDELIGAMKKSKKTIVVLILLAIQPLLAVPVFAQDKLPEPWISYPSANNQTYGVYHFRKSFDLDKVPEKLMVHVSADNRYHLFINGRRVIYGPAKGDLKTYKYDIVDIAPYLKQGNNLLAALVYNAGKDMPMSMFSVQTAFLLRSEDSDYQELNTGTNWKVLKNEAYTPVSYYEMLFRERWFYGYYACGPGDRVKAEKHPWGWETVDYDDSDWTTPEILQFEGDPPWSLVPRNIPFMANHREAPQSIRLVTGIDIVSGVSEKITIPANTSATILYDYEVLTMGYPELTLEDGRGSSVKIKYAEALYEKVNLKAHRDSVNNLTMYGVWDEFFSDGERRTYRPLWKRAFRYVQLVVETSDEALDILSLESEYSGYPYQDMASFESNDSQLNEIFSMSQRTLRMCSGETYYDTPFYEQLSYGGDNRPIGNISFYNTTDDRLFKEAMRLYPQSENRETGLYKSAYPSRFDFDMGSWSLAWIQGLHDYYMTRGDKEFVEQFVPKIERVLGFYERHMDESMGILATVKNQNFMDWSITKGSLPRSNEDKEMIHSTMLTLFYLHTLDLTVKLLNEFSMKDKAIYWEGHASKIRKAVRAHSYDETLGLFTDVPGKRTLSQHSNILAILCDVVPESEQVKLLDRILQFDQFEEYASSYFSFFLYKAMEKTGQQHLYLDHLNHWEKFINMGLTTTGETGFASHDRSDCHAWSAHPAYFLLSMVCGIQPGTIGFDEVYISPSIGSLNSIQASMPHANGRILVDYQKKGKKLRATVTLPMGTSGVWEYAGEKMELKEGVNKIK